MTGDTPIDFTMIANAKTVFPIVTFDDKDSWPAVLDLSSPHLDQRGLDRLCKVLDGECLCVVIERHYIDRDYRDTFSHFHSKRFSTPDARCLRLHFFSEAITGDEIAAGQDKIQNSYLGYSVIRPTKPNCVGRTLLTHTLRLNPVAHLSLCEERVHLLGTRIHISGFPFISQDADATVCAESALWMLLRYYSNRYRSYSESLPFQITNLANHHAIGRRVYPSAGLYSWQLAEALRLQRFSPVVYSRNQFRTQFDHLLYTYIESGLPLLITVPGHVVVAFGHASDYSQNLVPSNPAFRYSSHFNCSFIINDDNKFPYQTMARDLRTNPEDSIYSWSDIAEFIVPLPEKVFLTAEQAQTAIEAVLLHPEWGLQASPTLAGKSILLRLFLTSGQSFKRMLRARKMGNSLVEQVYRYLPLPHFIWVCEIAEQAEYSSGHMVQGEILWDATRNAHEPDGWIALHLPESLVVDIGSAVNSSQKLQKIALDEHNSYSLFRSNLHSLSLHDSHARANS